MRRLFRSVLTVRCAGVPFITSLVSVGARIGLLVRHRVLFGKYKPTEINPEEYWLKTECVFFIIPVCSSHCGKVGFVRQRGGVFCGQRACSCVCPHSEVIDGGLFCWEECSGVAVIVFQKAKGRREREASVEKLTGLLRSVI